MRHIERVIGNLYQFESSRIADRTFAECCFNSGIVAENSGDIKSAIKLYHETLTYDQGNASAWINIGTILFRKKHFSMAAGCYRKALAIDPENVLANYDIGNVLDELNLLSKAAAHYLQALREDPQYANAHFNLGIDYAKIGESRKAVRHYRLYLKYRSDDEEVWADRARQAIERLQRHDLFIVRKSATSIEVAPEENFFTAQR
jgi:tetratricopeptide (TPR) repeat protein